MQILRLEAENFKRLRAVQIDPRGDLVLVTGRNAQGKSTVLDAISAALSGAGACPADPIRHGEASAQIRLDLGDVVVTRRFTPGGSTLTLTNAEGAKFPSPQKMLDSLLGSLTFDPLEFIRMKPRDQFDQLKAVARVELDLEKLDGLNRAEFDRRTELNREAKAARAQIEGLRVPADPGPARDVAQLAQNHQDLANMRMDAQRERDDRRRMQNEMDAKRTQVEQLRQQALALQEQIKSLRASLEANPATAEPEQFDTELATLQEQVRTAQAHNDQVQQHRQAAARRAELEAQAKSAEDRAAALTGSMEARQAAKEQALAAAQFPVPGLGLGDGLVTYNGVPLAQASSAEQLRISTALAMAANPKVKVVLIREGSLLDEDGLRLVAEMATAQGYQVWVEAVSNRKDVGIVIEDGEVIADNQAEEGMEVPA